MSDDHKKVWAAGFFAGLKKNKGEKMNAARFKSKINNLSASEKRVFDAVPIATAWTIEQITTEYKRAYLSNINLHECKRCLLRLAEAGLVHQINNKLFQKDQPPDILPPAKLSPVPKSTPDPKQKNEVEHNTAALDRLYTQAEQLRQLAVNLEGLIVEIEAAVLAVQAEQDTQREQYEKLHQLRSLLGELGGV